MRLIHLLAINLGLTLLLGVVPIAYMANMESSRQAIQIFPTSTPDLQSAAGEHTCGVVDFTGYPQIGPVPLTVTAVNLSQGCLTDTIFIWDLDDGYVITTTINEMTFTVVYTKVGEHTEWNKRWRLDAISPSSTDKPFTNKGDFISVRERCQLGFTPLTGTVLLPVSFTLQYIGSSYCAEVDAWEWDFGDGYYTNSIRNPIYTYADKGEYTVAITTTDHHFGIYTKTGPIKILPKVCEVDQVTILPTFPKESDSFEATIELNELCTSASIRWKRNGNVLSAFSNAITKTQGIVPFIGTSKTVPAEATLDGDQWCISIIPYENNVEEAPFQKCIRIGNAAPLAQNVKINPSFPLDTEALILSYTYYDEDGDLESDFKIRWYRGPQLANIVLQTGFATHTKKIPPDSTKPNEIWCAVVQVKDQIDYGPPSDQVCIPIGTVDNRSPQMISATLVLTQQNTNSEPLFGLVLNYVYTDTEADILSPMTEIMWYRKTKFQDSLFLQSAYNNLLEITKGQVIREDVWQAVIRPHDGHSYGLPFETDLLPILGAPPYFDPMPPTIYPAQACIGKPLSLIYNYFDADGDDQRDTIIEWYKNLEPQSTYTGRDLIPANALGIGDVWYAWVTLHDGYLYGNRTPAKSVLVGPDCPNSPPYILPNTLTIYPQIPGDDEDICVIYKYGDDDGDLEGDTKIHWTTVGWSPFDNVQCVPAKDTEKGQEWCVTVTPHDGKDYGKIYKPPCVTVVDTGSNSRPVVTNVHIVPERPKDEDYLMLVYDYFDGDLDPEGSHLITWYKDDVPQPEFENNSRVRPGATEFGQKWFAVITPTDSISYGNAVTAPPIMINKPPTVGDVQIVVMAKTIRVNYTYSDPDGDPEDPSPRVQWYFDGELQNLYNDQIQIPGRTGVWTVTVEVNDGVEYSQASTSQPTDVLILSVVYLPTILKLSPEPNSTPTPTPCSNEAYHENNDDLSNACEIKLGEKYLAYPDDNEDWYYLILTQTSSIWIQVVNYDTSQPGQMLFYDKRGKPGLIAYEPYLSLENNLLPNGKYPHSLNNLPQGRYYIRVYSYQPFVDPTLEPTKVYTIWAGKVAN